VKGGTVIGKVDAKGGEVTDRPVNAQDFLATMCHALGIDFQKEYTTKEGRPMTFLGPKAAPVKEAF
jgi:arylsulfatase A-like enzyme